MHIKADALDCNGSGGFTFSSSLWDYSPQKFSCPDPTCEYHTQKTFGGEEELEGHVRCKHPRLSFSNVDCSYLPNIPPIPSRWIIKTERIALADQLLYEKEGE